MKGMKVIPILSYLINRPAVAGVVLQTRHMSHVTCHEYFFFFLQIGENSRWRVCYQQGLPRLISFDVHIVNSELKDPFLFFN